MADLDPAQILARTEWEAAMEHVKRCRLSTPVRAMAALLGDEGMGRALPTIAKVKAGYQDLDR